MHCTPREPPLQSLAPQDQPSVGIFCGRKGSPACCRRAQAPGSIQPIRSGPNSAAASAPAGGLQPARQRRDRPADRSGTGLLPSGSWAAAGVPPIPVGGTVDDPDGRSTIMEQAQYTDGVTSAGAPSSMPTHPASCGRALRPSPPAPHRVPPTILAAGL